MGSNNRKLLQRAQLSMAKLLLIASYPLREGLGTLRASIVATMKSGVSTWRSPMRTKRGYCNSRCSIRSQPSCSTRTIAKCRKHSTLKLLGKCRRTFPSTLPNRSTSSRPLNTQQCTTVSSYFPLKFMITLDQQHLAGVSNA